MPSLLERVALLGLGGVLALLLERILLARNGRRMRIALLGSSRPSGVPEHSSLQVTRMASADEEGKAFVIQGYKDVQVAEGKIADEEEMKVVRAGLDALRDGDGGSGVLLCESAGRRVGYLWYLDAAACPFGPGCYACESEPYIWVHTVYTHQRMRRRGVATALYRHLDGVARDCGRTAVWLDVYDNNPGSASLHRGLGFAPVTTVYRKSLAHAESREGSRGVSSKGGDGKGSDESNGKGGSDGGGEGGGRIAIILRLEVDPERVDEFVEVARYDAQQTIAEPGCDRFDVMRIGPTSFVFYEIYASERAIADHCTTPHWQRWDEFERSGAITCSHSDRHELLVKS